MNFDSVIVQGELDSDKRVSHSVRFTSRLVVIFEAKLTENCIVKKTQKKPAKRRAFY